MSARRAAVVAVIVMATAGGCGSSGESGGGAAADTVKVRATEYAFEPKTIEVPAGRTVFAVTNKGSEEHEFEVFRGSKLMGEIEGITPGITRELKVDLDAGEYTYVCKLPGHEGKGQTGTLTVTQA